MLMFNIDTDIIVDCKGRTTIQVYNFKCAPFKHTLNYTVAIW